VISPAYITEWSQQCPWTSPAQVEQDLVLSRGLVEIYSDPILRERLLFRGGTALHKIVLQPAARYSEDLDFVQLREQPIGSTLDLLRKRLNPWLGEPKSDIGPRGATLTYRFESELPPVIRLRLKIEINTREHLCLLPIQQTEFVVDSRWFSGEATLVAVVAVTLLGVTMACAENPEAIGNAIAAMAPKTAQSHLDDIAQSFQQFIHWQMMLRLLLGFSLAVGCAWFIAWHHRWRRSEVAAGVGRLQQRERHPYPALDH